jgi:hypothetical protein
MSIRDRVGPIALIAAVSTMALGIANAQDARKNAEPAQLQSFPNLLPSNKAAPQFTPWAKVTVLQSGWFVDRMLVFIDAPGIVNPDGCTLDTNGYILNENHTGRNLFNTMLLSAFLNGREVALVISGCWDTRPQVVSVAIH